MQNPSQNKKSESGILKRVLSFQYAFNGLLAALKSEPNMWIHLIATAGVIVAGYIYELTRLEWIIVVFCIGFVIAAEMFNSALEYLADAVHPEFHDKIKKAKDISAGAVLIAAFIAAVAGLFIFIPKISG